MHRQFCQLVFPEPCLTFGKSFGVAATVQREVSLQNRVDDPSRQSLSLVEGPSARFHISPPVGRVLSLAGRSADRLTPVNPQHSHFRSAVRKSTKDRSPRLQNSQPKH